MRFVPGSTGGSAVLSLSVAVLLLTGTGEERGSEATSAAAADGVETAGFCLPTDAVAHGTPPDFYEIPLVPTGNVPGTGGYEGVAEVTFKDTPFDVAVSEDGAFHRQIRVDLSGLEQPDGDGYVVWVSPPELEPVKKLGVLGSDGRLTGEVSFPKYLVIVTLEENPEEIQGRWQGPVVHRGMSRSGFMHGMVGHGPFRQEPCANYGFQ